MDFYGVDAVVLFLYNKRKLWTKKRKERCIMPPMRGPGMGHPGVDRGPGMGRMDGFRRRGYGMDRPGMPPPPPPRRRGCCLNGCLMPFVFIGLIIGLLFMIF